MKFQTRAFSFKFWINRYYFRELLCKWWFHRKLKEQSFKEGYSTYTCRRCGCVIYIGEEKEKELLALKNKPLPSIAQKPKFTKLPKCPVEMKTSFMEKMAKKEAVRLSKKNHAKMRAYRCMFCDYWHLSSKKNNLTKH